MNDTVISIIRTVAPTIAALIVTGFVALGVDDVDVSAVTAVVVAALTGIWYTVVKLLGRKVTPKAEVLNGWPTTPTYES